MVLQVIKIINQILSSILHLSSHLQAVRRNKRKGRKQDTVINMKGGSRDDS